MRNAAVVPSIVFALAIIAAPLAAQQRTPALVYGRVIDRQSGDPVVAADLWLDSTELHRMSDQDGRFDFGEVPPGSYLLHIEHIGYRAIADTLDVGAGKYLDLDVQMAPRAIELEPLVVVAEYDGGSKLAGFYERQRMTMGSFITRKDVEQQHSGKVSDLFRSVRGMHVVPARSPSGLDLGYHVLMRGNCRPTLYIDGAETMPTSMSIDQMVQLDDVQGIEIYRGPETPVEFQRNPCGAILVWTRPGGGRGGIKLWKGLLIVGAALGLVLLFSH
ncbi:MAG TPA: TonB-dependent receptor [Longimicrobiales bacterium]|nr:TonB-dependent receptor [Longimicrobiales bacterium]